MTGDPPAAVAPEDPLLRRVLNRPDFLEWHDDFRRWIPSLAAVRFDQDGMSAFVRGLLEERSHGPADVGTLGGTSNKPAVVYEFNAQAVSDIGFSSKHSPNDDTPIGYAHVSMLKPDA